MTGDRAGDARWAGAGSLADEAVWAATVFLLAAAVRLTFLARLDVPPFDPWRHLALVRNLREGVGFTLFDGQPYLWYGPTWHALCAAAPAWLRMEWIAGALSALAAPATYLLARRLAPSSSRVAALAAGAMMAASGPVVAYTCHYGPEAPALLLLLAALLAVAAFSGTLVAVGAGMAFGTALVLRLNLVFDGFLFLPWLGRPRRLIAFALGAAAPLGLTWWRNHGIIAAHPWVFTWDGLATRSADFGLLSTLAIQLHPAVQAGLRTLHLQVIPWPEWIVGAGGPAWGTIVFVAAGTAGVLLARRWALALAGGSALFYFLALDRSLSANFFRIYLVVFPVFFLGTALAAQRAWSAGGLRRLAGLALVVVVTASGAAYLEPAPGVELEAFTPPDGFVTGERFLVNSGLYHPESLIWRYPGRSFLGLPLDPAQLDSFLADHPERRVVIWHEVGVQDAVREALLLRPGARVEAVALNAAGRRYERITLP